MTFENISIPPVAPQYRRAPVFSWPYFIVSFFRILEYLIPLLIVMFTNEMWRKTGEFMEMPGVEFSGNFLVVFNGENNHIYSSSFPVLNGADIDHFRLIEQKHHWEDMTDHRILHLSIKMPITSAEVSTLMYFIYFQYNLEYHSIVHAELPIVDTIILPRNLSKVTIFGNLSPDQSRPLRNEESWEIINNTRRDVDHYKPDEVLNRLACSPLTLKLSRMSKMMQSKRSRNSLEVNFNIIVNTSNFVYQNGIMDLLKWFWIQFICLYMLMRYILDTFFSYLYTAQYDF